MSRPIEAIIYHLAPPLNRLRAGPDTTKIFARWQSGLETPFGCKQWKLSLRRFTEPKYDEAVLCNRASDCAVVGLGEDWAWCYADVVMCCKMGARNARQVEGNVAADELYRTDEEIAEIEGRNTYEPELVTAV